MQYSPWLQQLKSMAGRMVGPLVAPAPRAVRPLAAEPYPAFGDTQPMCFETRRPEPAATQRPAPR
jgi:hypothetical protein